MKESSLLLPNLGASINKQYFFMLRSCMDQLFALRLNRSSDPEKVPYEPVGKKRDKDYGLEVPQPAL